MDATIRPAGRRAAASVAVVLAAAFAGGPGGAVAAVDAGIRRALEAAPADPVSRAVRAEWSASGYAPRFVEPAVPHRATASARDALAAIEAADSRGLDAAVYGADTLRAALDRPRDATAAAGFEAALALAWGRFLADAGYGRIDPRRLGHDLPPQRRESLEPALRAALAAPGAAVALDRIEPTLPTYRALLDGLAEWHRRAALPPPAPLPRPARAGRVSPGDAWPGVDALRERLRREGDLDAVDAAVPGVPGVDPVPRYDGALVDAVRRFQARHGLDADGVIGPRTFAALDVPTAARVRQIERALERLRWLGELPAGRFVAVNIPAFRLTAVDAGRVVVSMAVVVGRVANRTPVFVDAIEAVELNPYWNVPRSIAARELYPRLAGDPGWLAAEAMELIGADTVPAADLRQALATGAVRLRQRPGERNALGRVKLVMPNAQDIYLHDTPARALFARSRRDFSHGCIRLERPLELAAFVLAERPGWPPERVAAAAATGRNQWLRLSSPVPVLILYSTVDVDEAGRLHFLPDVYGLDAPLDAALAVSARGR